MKSTIKINLERFFKMNFKTTWCNQNPCLVFHKIELKRPTIELEKVKKKKEKKKKDEK